MSEDYLTEDKINPSGQNFICISFFSKNYVKQVVDNNNEMRPEDQKIDYSTEDNILALKFRGAFDTYDEACKHAHNLRTVDPYHNVYVMESGKWSPFVIEDSDKFVKQTEHANEQLNEMMKKYVENQEKAKLYHEYRKNQMIQQSINDNLSNRRSVLKEMEDELANASKPEDVTKINTQMETVDEQINKLLEQQKELEEQLKNLEIDLDIKK